MYYFHVYFYHETSRNKSEYLIGNAFKIHLRATAISKNCPGVIPPDPANKGRGEGRERRGEGKGKRRDEEGEGRGGARTPQDFWQIAALGLDENSTKICRAEFCE